MKSTIISSVFIACLLSNASAIVYSMDLQLESTLINAQIDIEDPSDVTATGITSPLKRVSVQAPGFDQTFNDLDVDSFFLRITDGGGFGEWDFEVSIPLPEGLFGTTGAIYFYEGFSAVLSEPSPDFLQSFDDGDFGLFWDDIQSVPGGISLAATVASQDPGFGPISGVQFATGFTTDLQQVPEPTAPMLLVGSLFSFAFLRQRK